jgi:uncharacterized SAM-binding protein YcdF (DUF218 family)
MLRLIGFVLLGWAVGFGIFMLQLAKPLEGVKTDAIVVLTGGYGRLDRGLTLMQAKAADRMLISGVAPAVRPVELADRYQGSSRLFRCCIDLGHEAVDTRSNAEETAQWVREHRYKSVRLVTSDWHMARARMELAHALGEDIEIAADGVPSAGKLKSMATLKSLIAEYNKFLLRRAALWLGIGT